MSTDGGYVLGGENAVAHNRRLTPCGSGCVRLLSGNAVTHSGWDIRAIWGSFSLTRPILKLAVVALISGSKVVQSGLIIGSIPILLIEAMEGQE